MELIFVFLIFGLLGVVLVFMNALLGPKKTNPAKEKPFECGSPALQAEIPPASVPFLVVALLFLILDVETVLLFPLAMAFRLDGKTSLAALSGSLIMVALGFLYAWKKGGFDWS